MDNQPWSICSFAADSRSSAVKQCVFALSAFCSCVTHGCMKMSAWHCSILGRETADARRFWTFCGATHTGGLQAALHHRCPPLSYRLLVYLLFHTICSSAVKQRVFVSSAYYCSDAVICPLSLDDHLTFCLLFATC